MIFWSDIWVDQAIKDKYPQLFSFTRKPKCSVRFFMSQQLNRIFSPLPLPQIAENQLEELQQTIQSRSWDDSIRDFWHYEWGTSKYSTKKVYNILIGSSPASPLFKWLWSSCN